MPNEATEAECYSEPRCHSSHASTIFRAATPAPSMRGVSGGAGWASSASMASAHWPAKRSSWPVPGEVADHDRGHVGAIRGGERERWNVADHEVGAERAQHARLVVGAPIEVGVEARRLPRRFVLIQPQ